MRSGRGAAPVSHGGCNRWATVADAGRTRRGALRPAVARCRPSTRANVPSPGAGGPATGMGGARGLHSGRYMRLRRMLPTRFHVAVSAWLLLAVLIQPGVGGAGDGVLEISQACALGGGCVPGDAPGFPVQIQAPGSYRLTTNLDLVYGPAPDLDTAAILIGADDVTIDLAGFAVLGPTRCPEPWTFPTTCPPAQSGVARGIDGVPRRRSSVHGGTVRGFPADGVILGDLARVRDLRVSQVGGHGIRVGQASIVARGQVSYTRGTRLRGRAAERRRLEQRGVDGRLRRLRLRRHRGLALRAEPHRVGRSGCPERRRAARERGDPDQGDRPRRGPGLAGRRECGEPRDGGGHPARPGRGLRGERDRLRPRRRARRGLRARLQHRDRGAHVSALAKALAGLALALGLLGAGAGARAADGVIEINQARALAGGITLGDTPGFPVAITQPGGYRLTGNLEIGAGVTAIEIAARDVTIDLHGFAILGPTSCAGAPSRRAPRRAGRPRSRAADHAPPCATARFAARPGSAPGLPTPRGSRTSRSR
ncbi:MAG: hypothetical protein MZV70_45425 [Desulfobacterales bacterium]|nr:hypothetical protein [Desulfobacterales bacterium]